MAQSLGPARTAGLRAYATAAPSAVIVAGVVVCIALLYGYWDVFVILVKQWSTHDAFSHGFLIPGISAYFVWQSRHRLAALPLAGALAAGTATLAFGLVMLVLGRSLDIVGIQELSLLPSLAGLVLLAGGFKALTVLWFPIAYLVFMMPVWDVVTERLHYPFQQLSARLGGHLIEVVGIPVLQDETFLYLPNVTLEVARVCSGVNYLIAVAAIGVPLAYFTFPDWLRRCLLVGFGLTIAVLANPVRVALIGVFSYFGLSTDLHGPGHAFQGLFVAAMGYAALVCGVAVLSRWGRRPSLAQVVPVAEEAKAPSLRTTDEPVAQALRPAWQHSGVALGLAVVLLLAAGAFRSAGPASRSDPSESLAELPTSLGSWTQIGPTTLGDTTGDATRTYGHPSGQRVELRFAPVIPDYDTRPPTWVDVVARQATPLTLNVSEHLAVTVNLANEAGGPGQTPVLYWYDIDGRVSNNRISAKLHAMWHRLMRRGRRPIAVFVRGRGSDALSKGEALRAATGFSSALIAALRLPLEQQSATSAAERTEPTVGEPSQP